MLRWHGLHTLDTEESPLPALRPWKPYDPTNHPFISSPVSSSIPLTYKFQSSHFLHHRTHNTQKKIPPYHLLSIPTPHPDPHSHSHNNFTLAYQSHYQQLRLYSTLPRSADDSYRYLHIRDDPYGGRWWWWYKTLKMLRGWMVADYHHQICDGDDDH